MKSQYKVRIFSEIGEAMNKTGWYFLIEYLICTLIKFSFVRIENSPTQLY